jgi:hypothetical protein
MQFLNGAKGYSLPTAAGFGKPDVTSSGALIFRAVSF